jgi:hypothetical protein
MVAPGLRLQWMLIFCPEPTFVKSKAIDCQASLEMSPLLPH